VTVESKARDYLAEHGTFSFSIIRLRRSTRSCDAAEGIQHGKIYRPSVALADAVVGVGYTENQKFRGCLERG
jgi:hypothetical protein